MNKPRNKPIIELQLIQGNLSLGIISTYDDTNGTTFNWRIPKTFCKDLTIPKPTNPMRGTKTKTCNNAINELIAYIVKKQTAEKLKFDPTKAELKPRSEKTSPDCFINMTEEIKNKFSNSIKTAISTKTKIKTETTKNKPELQKAS